MEKAKTAEEILFNHDPRKHKYTGPYYQKWQIDAMEEYAEQARREVINYIHIETHNKIVETRVELYKATQNEIVDRKLYDLDIFIGQKADAAAGYGKEEA